MYSNLEIVTYLIFIRKFYFYWQRRVNLYPGEDLGELPQNNLLVNSQFF